MRPWFYQGLQIQYGTVQYSSVFEDHYIFLYSTYHVVVVEEDSSRQVRRRELGHMECFPAPSSHGETLGGGGGASGVPPHYYTAELPPSSLPEATPFTVGDNHTYNGYWNTPLDPSKNYLIYFQASSNFRGVSDPICPLNAHKELMYVWAIGRNTLEKLVYSKYPVMKRQRLLRVSPNFWILHCWPSHQILAYVLAIKNVLFELLRVIYVGSTKESKVFTIISFWSLWKYVYFWIVTHKM